MGRCGTVSRPPSRHARRPKAAARPAPSLSGRPALDLGSWRSPALAAATVGVPLLLIGALAWPLLFTNATFNQDWLNHLWYMWHQSLAIRDDHVPSLFLSYSRGVLYPLYAFYGGTIYALAGALSLALGDAPLETYILTYLLAFAAAYGGWYWMSRMFGLGRWVAHAPGLVFITSASYLTTLYALGDWPEFLGVSIMPLMIAAGLSVLRSDRLRLWPALALAGSCIAFFGCHLLTVIWGSTILLIVGLAILAFVPQARREVTRPRLLRVLGLVVPALLVSAWFLLPTVAYESQTVIAASYPRFRALIQSTAFSVADRHLFTLSRKRAGGTILTLSLPILAIAWALVSVAISATVRRTGTWMRVFLVVSGATILVGIIMTHAGIILALPRVFATLQFTFRLESYVLLGISGAVLAALVLARNAGANARLWNWMLVPVAVVSVVGGIEQASAYTPGLSRTTALSSYLVPVYEEEGLLDYVDDKLPIMRKSLPRVTFPPSSVQENRASKVIHEPPGQLVDSNLRSAPSLVHITGARIVATDAEADDVLEINSYIDPARSGQAPTNTAGAPAPAETISVSPSNTFPVIAGRLLSVIGIAALALQLAVPAARRVKAIPTR
jgi:hypothetical protein